MRLYLSSFRVGEQPEALVSLAGQGRRTAIILNALDNRLAARDEFLLGQTAELQAHGFITEELDLRNFFGKPAELEERLRDIDVVW